MPSKDYQTGLIAGLMTKGVVDGVAGEIEITENGEYDVTNKATAKVNVAGDGGKQAINSPTIATVAKTQNIALGIPTSASTIWLPMTDVEATRAGTTIFVLNGNIVIEKATDDMCICGYYKKSPSASGAYAIFVSPVENAVKNIINGTALTAYSLTWNNQTFYYSVASSYSIVGDNIVCGTDIGSPKETYRVISSYSNYAAEALLKYYYWGQS